MSESSDNKPDESFLSEVSIEDGENTEPVDWKLNNTNLAKENALLRKEIQRYANIFKENSIRCNNLEVAWRRRGETLAKVDIISRLAGTQILKLLDSLTELRTACQVDLQTPLEGATGQVSHLRHSLPSKSDKLGIPTNVKPQLVNHVNPMVSGHPIIKPTITLRRLNINTSTRPQEEEILEPVEEVVLSGSENQSSESEDEEDDIVIPPNFRRLASPTLSSNGTPYYSFDLPVAEVPLVRLSMSNISERTETGVQDQNRNICNDRSEMHSEIDFVHSDNEVIEIDSTPANISSTSDSSLPTTANSASTSDSLLPTTANSASTSGSSLPANSMRKYPGSSSKLSEDRKSDILAGVEKCRLVVSLRDVGSYLHNGILSSIEQLEEGKVKTGASAQPESKDSPSCINDELQLNETATAAQDQTELNFSAIGNLNYSAVPIRNDNVEGSSSSSSKEFLSKLQKEDPLEGPSWRYSGLKTSSKRKGRCTQNTSSPPKKRNQSANRSSRQKKQIPASLKSSSKLSKGNHDEAQCEDDDGTNLTNCVALPVKTDVSPTDCKYEEQTNYSASSNEGPPVLEVQENFSITKNNKKRKGKSSGVKVKVERCNPNRKPPSLKKETNAATPQANRKPPYLKNETIEVAPVFDSKIKDKTESSTSSDEFLGFPTSNVSDENANMTRKRRKLLSLGSDADEEENEDEDYIPPSQRSKNSKRGTTSRKPKGKSVNSRISKKKKKADNTNVVQGKSGSLPAATEVQTDVETKKKNPPKKVAKRRSRSLQRKSGNLQAATEVHTDVGTKTKKPRKNVTKRRSRLTPTFERKHESPQAGAEVHSDEETYTKKSPKTVTKRRSSSVPTLERNQESLLVAAELQTDVETRTKNSPNNVTTRRSSSRTAAKKLRQSQRI